MTKHVAVCILAVWAYVGVLASLSHLDAKPLKQIKVAVIDTGIDAKYSKVLCTKGSEDLTGRGMEDQIGHGTMVSGIIYALSGQRQGYPICQIMLKYYHTDSATSDKQSIPNATSAFRRAIDAKVQLINYSVVGNAPDFAERKVIKEALDKGIKIIVPSGNKRVDLDKSCNVYPACYDKRLIVVGRSDIDNVEERGFGYGSIVDAYADGAPGRFFGYSYEGTSMATALVTARLIAKEYGL